MSERYTRLFSLPENLYNVGSPLIITAGALSKDNQTGGVLAQLEFTSVSEKEIKAVSVELEPKDSAGRSIGGKVNYQYLDLSVSRGSEFGSKNAIRFDDATVRSFNVNVTEVIYADNTIWSNPDGSFVPLPKPAPFTANTFKDPQLTKQFEL